jgi:hypothetical protein
MKTKNKLVLILFVSMALCLYFAPAASAASAEEEVLQVATNFVKAMNDNNSELMASLWMQSPKTTYFNPSGKFLSVGWVTNTPGGGEMFSLSHPRVTMLGDDAAIITAYFTIMKLNEATKQLSSEDLKETLVVQKNQGKWLIVHEHSSFLPK